MGRSQSTPGLVESRGKIALEDMWLPPVGLTSLTPGYPRSLLGSPPKVTPDSPGSTSSGRSRHHTPASQARSGKSVEKSESVTRHHIHCITCYSNYTVLHAAGRVVVPVGDCE